MKTIGIVFLLIWLPFFVSAQSAGPIYIDPASGLPSSTSTSGQFVIDPATGLPVKTNHAFAKLLQGLDKMADEADVVFKGIVISSRAITNKVFPEWGKPFATEFEVTSLLKGNVPTKSVTFLHITGQPLAWGGGTIPSHFMFEAGKSYIIFAMKADKPDYLFQGLTLL